MPTKLDCYMARVGYIMSFKHLKDELNADIQWMKDHGCCTIYIEDERNEKDRIEWKDMLGQLACGDEIVISKFSHAVRGSREFSVFCDYLRREKVTVISIHDKMDTSGKVFEEKTLVDFMDMLATLPTETIALRQAHEHESKLKARKHPRTKIQTPSSKPQPDASPPLLGYGLPRSTAPHPLQHIVERMHVMTKKLQKHDLK